MKHQYLVTVEAATKAQADHVIIGQLGYDEKYGFEYSVQVTSPGSWIEYLEKTLVAVQEENDRLLNAQWLAEQVVPEEASDDVVHYLAARMATGQCFGWTKQGARVVAFVPSIEVALDYPVTIADTPVTTVVVPNAEAIT